MVRNLLTILLAGLALVGATALVAHAARGAGGTSWRFGFTAAEGASTGTRAAVRPSKLGPSGEYVAAVETVVLFPRGSMFDSAAAPRCKGHPTRRAGTGATSCRRAVVGGGRATTVVGNSSSAPGTRLRATVTVFNRARGLWLVLQPCALGSGPGAGRPCQSFGGPMVLGGRLDHADRRKAQPRLTIPTPKAVLDQNIVIETLQLATRRITRGRGSRQRRLVTTPAACRGTWLSRIRLAYVDGTRQTIAHRTPCSRSAG